ncbi:MAG: 2-amino-4-hydroxy-6-hydroxymethyldihydropteridine diphosphokinase [Anaerolineae bacterium]|nr:2-amino-4-hydroxy-6-hydroxymethyldihydropteridine diphosphokinase [Anaerolineae bacterium]
MTAYVSLGSNIEPERNLAQAVRLLRTKCAVLAVSSVYRTPPQGYTDQPDFLNMAVKISTTLAPYAFKTDVLGWIERELKRVRDPLNKNAPRTIDLDISLWGDEVLDYGPKPWHVPDPDISRFAHVAVPLAELAPEYVHPERGQTLAAIAAGIDTTGMVRGTLVIE